MAQVVVLPTPLAEPSEDRSVPVNKDQPECPSSDKSQIVPAEDTPMPEGPKKSARVTAAEARKSYAAYLAQKSLSVCDVSPPKKEVFDECG